MSSGSRDSASMTRPENSGSSNWGRRERKSSETASVGISFRASVRMNPGQNDTAATLWGARSNAMSYVILSVPAFAAPYAGPTKYERLDRRRVGKDGVSTFKSGGYR